MNDNTQGGYLAQDGSTHNVIKILCDEYQKYNNFDPANYEIYNVKRGLRNPDGTGVMAGVTQICNVHGYVMNEGEKMPVEGQLIYRGINIHDIIAGCVSEGRYGFEETCWLLLFGSLPTPDQLALFNDLLEEYRELPDSFTDDMIIKAPSRNIMNKLARAVLALYSYDDNPDDIALPNVMMQSIRLIASAPSIMTAAYQVKRRAYDHKSMYFHTPKKGLSTAQNILRTMRSDKMFTEEEARLLDTCLILHAEHGGGNNSTFATRVLTSSGTDTYSAIAAGIGSLKGPKHGGANLKVMEMLEYMKAGISNWNDEGEVKDFLVKLIRKEEGDRSGLIYGMGHAVYTLSDPRAVILKKEAEKLAANTEMEGEFKLLSLVEKLTPGVFAEVKGDKKVVSANVDLYSGLVYRLLKIPEELFTPMFAIARIGGWCAHRIEELVTGGRIIRPAYKAVAPAQPYVALQNRKGE